MESDVPETIIEHDFFIDEMNRKKWFKVGTSRVVTNDRTFGVLSFVDITTEKENLQLLKSQLSLDAATGAFNKYALVNLLNDLVTRKDRLTVVMIDIDDFKFVNDRYGHLAGDRVLNLFCSAAFTNTRKQDIIARFGGDEFMVILPGTVTWLVIKALQRISTSFHTACTNQLGFSPTFSAGIAELSSDNIIGMSVEDIITQVDEKLYASKKAGKNRVTASGISQTFK